MASTKLRLLLDESIDDRLASLIMEMVRSAIYVRDNAATRGKKDTEIAAFADRERRMVVAVDGDLNRNIAAAPSGSRATEAGRDESARFSPTKESE